MPEFYEGQIRIEFRAVRDTSKLVLHLVDLELVNSSLMVESSTENSFTPMINLPWTLNVLTSQLTIDLNTKLFRAGNNYSFSARFNGFPKDNNIGFFRTSYLNANGNRRFFYKQRHRLL